MKTRIFLKEVWVVVSLSLVAGVSLAHPPPPPAASTNEVAWGTNTYKYISPATLANAIRSSSSGASFWFTNPSAPNSVSNAYSVTASNFVAKAGGQFIGDGAGLTNLTASASLQTPWLQDIDGNSHDLTNFNRLAGVGSVVTGEKSIGFGVTEIGESLSVNINLTGHPDYTFGAGDSGFTVTVTNGFNFNVRRPGPSVSGVGNSSISASADSVDLSVSGGGTINISPYTGLFFYDEDVDANHRFEMSTNIGGTRITGNFSVRDTSENTHVSVSSGGVHLTGENTNTGGFYLPGLPNVNTLGTDGAGKVIASNNGTTLTNILEKNVIVTTNGWGNSVLNFSLGTQIETNLTSNLTLSGIDGFVTSNLNWQVVGLYTDGSIRTVTVPAPWVVSGFTSATAVDIPANTFAKLTVEALIGRRTNATIEIFTP